MTLRAWVADPVVLLAVLAGVVIGVLAFWWPVLASRPTRYRLHTTRDLPAGEHELDLVRFEDAKDGSCIGRLRLREKRDTS